MKKFIKWILLSFGLTLAFCAFMVFIILIVSFANWEWKEPEIPIGTAGRLSLILAMITSFLFIKED